MSYAHLFENCDHVIEGNILLDIASTPPVLIKALIYLKHLEFDITAAELSAHLLTPGNA